MKLENLSEQEKRTLQGGTNNVVQNPDGTGCTPEFNILRPKQILTR